MVTGDATGKARSQTGETCYATIGKMLDGHYGDAAFLDVVEIPEPSVVALLGLGVIGRLRRRMSKKARGRRGRST